MNENTGKGRIKSVTGIDCVIAWLEPICKDDPCRKIKASAVRQRPPVGNGFWEIAIELDDEKLGDMSLYREGNTYARKICRALVAAAAQNRKARRDKERKAWPRAAVMNVVHKGSVFEFGTASLRPGWSPV